MLVLSVPIPRTDQSCGFCANLGISDIDAYSLEIPSNLSGCVALMWISVRCLWQRGSQVLLQKLIAPSPGCGRLSVSKMIWNYLTFDSCLILCTCEFMYICIYMYIYIYIHCKYIQCTYRYIFSMYL